MSSSTSLIIVIAFTAGYVLRLLLGYRQKNREKQFAQKTATDETVPKDLFLAQSQEIKALKEKIDEQSAHIEHIQKEKEAVVNQLEQYVKSSIERQNNNN